MPLDPVRNQVRKARKEHRLGEDAKCFLCPEKDNVVLGRYPWSLLQEHHLFGRNHDPETTVILCQNCHVKETAAQLDAGVDLREKDLFIESLPEMMRSLQVFLQTVVDKLGEWADGVTDFLNKLDKQYQGWRERF